jgi:ubiquinone/menaquinone biosynthesis C-methylase UbiE
MGRTICLRELLLGVEGAALFRHLVDCDQEFAEARIDGLRRLLARFDEPQLAFGIEVPELDVATGYTSWAPIYDTMDNALIATEEPLVDALTRDLPIGRALDVACGTGRHAARLAAAGHATVGIDATPAMLDLARKRAPGADFRLGDFTALPVDDGTFDLAICALALAHLRDPAPAIAEIARAVRPGGRVVLTDAHPTFVLIQGQAMFPTPGGLAFVRNHPVPIGTYLAAFRACGLTVLDCLEEATAADFSQGLFAEARDAATALFEGIPIALVWSLQKAA